MSEENSYLPSMKTGFIYSLNCPITGEVKYIGQTRKKLKHRLTNHISDRRKNKKSDWICYLKKKGLKPTIELIDEVGEDEINFWEMHYISLYRSWGFNLKNMTDGGDSNGKFSLEARRNISNALRGRKLSEEHKRNIGNSGKGRIMSEAHKNILRQCRKGNKFAFGVKRSEEFKKNVGERMKKLNKGNQRWLGKKHSEESRLKISSSHKGRFGGEKHWTYGKKRIAETVLKISDTKKAQHRKSKILQSLVSFNVQWKNYVKSQVA